MAMTVSITESANPAGAVAAAKASSRAADPVPRPDGGPPEVPESDLSFWDLLDVVNPLQHIPIVGSVYRAITGDEIRPSARVAGGMLYGGMVGLVASVASLAVERESGKDPGGHLLAMMGMEPETAEGEPGPTLAVLPDGDATPPQADEAMPDAVAALAGADSVSGPAAASLHAAAGPSEGGAVLHPAGRMFAVPPRIGESGGKVFPLSSRAVASAPPTGEPAAIPVAATQAMQDGQGKAVAMAEAGNEATGSSGNAAWPPGGPTPLPREFIADAMMNALQKYERTSRLGAPGRAGAGAVMPQVPG